MVASWGGQYTRKLEILTPTKLKTNLKACGPSVSQLLLKSSNKVVIEFWTSTISLFLVRSCSAISKNLIFSSSSVIISLLFFSRFSFRSLSKDVRRPFFSLLIFLVYQKFMLRKWVLPIILSDTLDCNISEYSFESTIWFFIAFCNDIANRTLH